MKIDTVTSSARDGHIHKILIHTQYGFVYQADCDQFDDHSTGFYETEREAIEAFWDEAWFSEREKQRAVPYTRRVEVGYEIVDEALDLAESGSPSPALGL